MGTHLYSLKSNLQITDQLFSLFQPDQKQPLSCLNSSPRVRRSLFKNALSAILSMKVDQISKDQIYGLSTDLNPVKNPTTTPMLTKTVVSSSTTLLWINI